MERIKSGVCVIFLSIFSVIFGVLPPLGYFGPGSITPDLEYSYSEYVKYTFLFTFVVTIVPLIVYLIRRYSSKKGYLVDNAISLYLGLSCTNFIVNLLKFVVGKKRPDYNSRERLFHSSVRVLNEGKRSFPSGHSATAVVGAIFIIYTTCEALSHLKSTWKKAVLIQSGVVLPSLTAAFVCISRVLDNRHDVVDVLSGMTIACVVCIIVIRSKNRPSTSGY